MTLTAVIGPVRVTPGADQWVPISGVKRGAGTGPGDQPGQSVLGCSPE